MHLIEINCRMSQGNMQESTYSMFSGLHDFLNVVYTVHLKCMSVSHSIIIARNPSKEGSIFSIVALAFSLAD